MITKLILKKEQKAVTLVELLIAIFLLSAVVLTGVSVQLATRQMQTKPTAKVKILDEMMPVVDRIKKDFDRQVGSLVESPSVVVGGTTLQILVDEGSELGKIDTGDTWYTYTWGGNPGDPIVYTAPTSAPININLAEGITNFAVTTPTGLNINEAITIFISKNKIPGQAADPITNPGMNITTTIYARGASLN